MLVMMIQLPSPFPIDPSLHSEIQDQSEKLGRKK